MTQRENISQELEALNSPLAGQVPGQTYTVPNGYFEGLAEQVLNRIRAMEARDAAAELGQLSPLLASLSRQMPYSLPEGYFDQLEQRLLHATGRNPGEKAEEETLSISPLLGQLKKENPYAVPAGYFDNLATDVAAKEKVTEARVLSLGRTGWFRYAAAAVVTGILFLAGFLIWNKGPRETQEGSQVLAKIYKDIKPLNETEREDLIDFLNAGMNGAETAQVNPDNKSKEIQQLLQDLSEEELKDFQEQTEDLGEVLMTN